MQWSGSACLATFDDDHLRVLLHKELITSPKRVKLVDLVWVVAIVFPARSAAASRTPDLDVGASGVPKHRANRMGDAIQGCLAGLGCASVDWLLRADEERAAAAAAEPLPEESTWAQYQTGDGDGHFFDNGGDELEPLLAHTTLIKAKWLLDLARGKVTLPKWRATDGSERPIVPPWQDVPPEAVVSLGELRATTMDFTLPIAVLVLPWASTVHPDPSGAVLQNLVPVLRAMARSTVYGAGGPGGGSPKAWGILWDFMSYPARGHTSGYDNAVDDRTPCTYHLPLTTCHLPLATCHLPLTTCHLPRATCHMPHATCHLPLATYVTTAPSMILHPALDH